MKSPNPTRKKAGASPVEVPTNRAKWDGCMVCGESRYSHFLHCKKHYYEFAERQENRKMGAPLWSERHPDNEQHPWATILCPRCEENRIRRDTEDYLCKACRYG